MGVLLIALTVAVAAHLATKVCWAASNAVDAITNADTDRHRATVAVVSALVLASTALEAAQQTSVAKWAATATVKAISRTPTTHSNTYVSKQQLSIQYLTCKHADERWLLALGESRSFWAILG